MCLSLETEGKLLLYKKKKINFKLTEIERVQKTFPLPFQNELPKGCYISCKCYYLFATKGNSPT